LIHNLYRFSLLWRRRHEESAEMRENWTPSYPGRVDHLRGSLCPLQQSGEIYQSYAG